MTKEDVRNRLLDGEIPDSIFRFRLGQECMIFKAEEFTPGDGILYIPDIGLNEIPLYKDLSADIEVVFDVLGKCYTGDDFIALCANRFGVTRASKKAEELFNYVDWQHPSSVLDAGELDDEDEEE